MSSEGNADIEHYYEKALQFTRSHYENFPVTSFFLKKDLQKHIAVVYQFSRQADDIADEGDLSDELRLKKLNDYRSLFEKSQQQKNGNGFWQVLVNTINEKQLSHIYFTDLLDAFQQDIVKKKYNDYDELLTYCRKSANPVGRLILELYDVREDEAAKYSDKICTALQLTNFCQDVKIDIQKNRVYLPQEELKLFNVEEQQIIDGKFNESFVHLMNYQVERIQRLFIEGRELLQFLPKSLKLQIHMTIKGGEAVLSKIEELNYNVLQNRPKLNRIDFLKLFFNSLILRSQ